MVLKSIISLYCLISIGITISDNYLRQLKKCVKSSLHVDHPIIKPLTPRNDIVQIFDQENLIGYALVSEVASCKLGGCQSTNNVSHVQSEYFDLMVILDKTKSIVEIKVLDYFSDYGYEISSKKYLKKFIGKDVCLFAQKNDNIDAISGATVSSNAIESQIASLCLFLNKK